MDHSLWTSLSTESHPNLCNNGAADESKGLPVTTLAALFCNFCKVFSLVSPQHPHTEQQQLRWGSTILKYMFLNVSSYTNCLAYFKSPTAREIFVRRNFAWLPHFKFSSIMTPRYLVSCTSSISFPLTWKQGVISDVFVHQP